MVSNIFTTCEIPTSYEEAVGKKKLKIFLLAIAWAEKRREASTCYADRACHQSYIPLPFAGKARHISLHDSYGFGMLPTWRLDVRCSSLVITYDMADSSGRDEMLLRVRAGSYWTAGGVNQAMLFL